MGFPDIVGKLSQMTDNKRQWKRKSDDLKAVLEKLKEDGVEEVDTVARNSILQSEYLDCKCIQRKRRWRPAS